LGHPHEGKVWKWPIKYLRAVAPEPAAWLTAPEVSYLSGPLGWTGLTNVDEQQLTPGLLPLAAILFALVAGFGPIPTGIRLAAAVVSGLAVVAVVVLVTPISGVWLYGALAELPVIGGVRAIGRVMLVLLFPAAVALAALLESLTAVAWRRGVTAGVSVSVLALAAVVADQLLVPPTDAHGGRWKMFRCPLAATLDRQSRITAAIRRHPAPTLVYAFPSAGEDRDGPIKLQPDTMRAAQDLGLPCVNGWSGHLPPHWDLFTDYFRLMVWLTQLNDTPPERLAGLVVIGEPDPEGRPLYHFTLRLAFPPQSPR
jgi:hypothetical protein